MGCRKYKAAGLLPIDVIVIDFFPDPKAMMDELNTLGIELMVSVWPQVDRHSENFEEMRQKGYLIKAERGVQTAMMDWFPASMYFDA